MTICSRFEVLKNSTKFHLTQIIEEKAAVYRVSILVKPCTSGQSMSIGYMSILQAIVEMFDFVNKEELKLQDEKQAVAVDRRAVICTCTTVLHLHGGAVPYILTQIQIFKLAQNLVFRSSA